MAWVKITAATLSGNSLRQTVHAHRASVHQAVKLVAALLRVARVTAGLEESNGSIPPGLWLTSPPGWLKEPGSALEPYAQQSSMATFKFNAYYRCVHAVFASFSPARHHATTALTMAPCLLQISVLSKRLDGSSWFFCMKASFGLIYPVVWKFRCLQKQGYLHLELWRSIYSTQDYRFWLLYAY